MQGSLYACRQTQTNRGLGGGGGETKEADGQRDRKTDRSRLSVSPFLDRSLDVSTYGPTEHSHRRQSETGGNRAKQRQR